jgi:hypothetical protein
MDRMTDAEAIARVERMHQNLVGAVAKYMRYDRAALERVLELAKKSAKSV